MSLPDPIRRDVEKLMGTYCETKIPERVRDQIRIEFEVDRQVVTLVERRPPFRPRSEDEEWTRFAIARLRFTNTTGLWTLYWRDRDERWRIYPKLKPRPSVAALLAEVDRDPTGIFWG